MIKIIQKYFKQFLGTTIYGVIVCLYLFQLSNYNTELLGKNIIEVMTYKNGMSWEYLFGAIGLCFVAAFLVYYLFSSLKKIEQILDSIILIVLMVIVLILVVLIIYHINNPILRAACCVTFLGGILLKS